MSDEASTSTKAGAAHFALLGAFASATGIIATIARSKVVAHATGPRGVGIIAEATQLVTLATTLASVFVGPALVAWLATAARDKDADKLERGIGTALVVASGLGILGCLIAIGLADRILPTGWEISPTYAVALVAGGAVLTLAATAINTLYIAAADLRRMTIGSIVSSLVLIVIAIVLTLRYGLIGNLWSIALGGVSSFLLARALLIGRPGGFVVRLRPMLDPAFVRGAFAVGTATLIAGVVGQTIFSSIRALLQEYGTRTGGPGAGEILNGNYQAASTIGTQYFAVIMGGLANYFWPRYAQARDTADLEREIHDATRFILRLGPPIIFGAIAFRDVLIRLLYSNRFDDAVSILGFQFAGDIAKAVAWAYGGALLYRARLRSYLFSEVVGGGLSVAACWLFLHWLGPVGTGVAYFASYSVNLVIVAITVQISTGARVNRAHLAAALGLTLLAGVFETALRWNSSVRWAVIPLIVGWGYWSGGIRLFVEKSQRVIKRLRGIEP